ncbi:hypothetical protein PV-S19_0327 [Pacmanvirus S19]|nr:hypothetical protein PV-S19_0327 [Pacmanvirus S19]
MTEELRQIALSIKSFTPGEFTVAANDTTYKIYNTISNKFEDALMKTIEGYDLCRYLNTIKASFTKKKVKFHLMRSSDVILGFYTPFNDSVVESIELHKTVLEYCAGDCLNKTSNVPYVAKTEIIPLEIKNSYCKLDIIMLAWENHNCEYKVVIHLKKQLLKSNGVVIAIDELFAKDYFREKQYDEKEPTKHAPVTVPMTDVAYRPWVCISHPELNGTDEPQNCQ